VIHSLDDMLVMGRRVQIKPANARKEFSEKEFDGRSRRKEYPNKEYPKKEFSRKDYDVKSVKREKKRY